MAADPADRFRHKFLGRHWIGSFDHLPADLCHAVAHRRVGRIPELEQIRATKRQKIGYLFTFPLFMMTYVPIAISAVFRKFQWQPIAHTYALTSEDMTKPVA